MGQCSCACTGDDLKACVHSCPSDKFSDCVARCENPCPSTTQPAGCPGGSLKACIAQCPSDKDLFQPCVNGCVANCDDEASCTGSDDGEDLKSCVSACPSDKYADCISCCENKFPTFL